MNFCVLNSIQEKRVISFLLYKDKLLINFKIIKSLSDQSEYSDKNHVILVNSRETPNLFVLTNIVIDFVFNKET